MSEITRLLDLAFVARQAFWSDNHSSAFRLFNGFLEGLPAICVDVYAHTVLIQNYATSQIDNHTEIVKTWVQEKLPWVSCIIAKTRASQLVAQRRGEIIHGDSPDQKIVEDGISYAINLMLNRDASFYLDTRNLRNWISANMAGKSVLNAFAYTGSLGVAALAGGAACVVQLDRSKLFLNIARESYRLNNLPVVKEHFIEKDFFPAVGQLKSNAQSFDCVLLDPPFFSSSRKGLVDLENNGNRLINKVRPLIKDGGTLVTINNALFLSGKEYIASLESLCSDGYLAIEHLVPVPSDFTGYAETRCGQPPVDPYPFNHSTKIAILRVRRKSTASQSGTLNAETSKA